MHPWQVGSKHACEQRLIDAPKEQVVPLLTKALSNEARQAVRAANQNPDALGQDLELSMVVDAEGAAESKMYSAKNVAMVQRQCGYS